MFTKVSTNPPQSPEQSSGLSQRPKQVVRLSAISELLDVSKSTINRLRAAGEFPQPFLISKQAVGYDLAEIQAWIDARKQPPARTGMASPKSPHPLDAGNDTKNQKGISMLNDIILDDEISELLQVHSSLTGLSISALVDRLLTAHLGELHEVLALVTTHPELSDEAANLIISYGPDSIDAGIKRIAPATYELLGDKFERDMKNVATEIITFH